MSGDIFPPVFDRDEVFSSYLETMVWMGHLQYLTGPEEFGGEVYVEDVHLEQVFRDDVHNSLEELLPADILAAAREDVNNFLDMIEPRMEDYPRSNELTAEQLGHDFCLTRNHTGAGFWDRGLSHLGDYLTEASHSFGSAEVCGGVILKNPKLPDPELLARENLDLDTLKVWAIA